MKLNCELCEQSGIETKATKSIWTKNPFGNTGARYVELCEICAAEWKESVRGQCYYCGLFGDRVRDTYDTCPHCGEHSGYNEIR
jgi:hypothetical protein